VNLATLPNILTVARIIAVPVVVALFYWGGPLGDPLAALVFILAAITDWTFRPFEHRKTPTPACANGSMSR